MSENEIDQSKINTSEISTFERDGLVISASWCRELSRLTQKCCKHKTLKESFDEYKKLNQSRQDTQALSIQNIPWLLNDDIIRLWLRDSIGM